MVFFGPGDLTSGMFKGSFPFFVAIRYLKPSRRTRFLSFITAVSAIGVMFGTCALLVSLSILKGFNRTLESTIVDFMGHIEMNSYFEVDSLANAPGVMRRVKQEFPQVESMSPFVRREAIIRSDNGLEGVLLKGIDPANDVSTVRTKIREGTFELNAAAGELAPLVIGERLADKLQVGVGDTVVLFISQGVPNLETPPVIEQFVVRGTYRSGMAQYDDIYIFTAIESARAMVGYAPDEVSGFDILLDDPDKIRETAMAMNDTLGKPFFAQPVFEIFSSVFAWIDLQRMMIPVVMAVIAIVATFNVISTLLMTVLEKSESIGTLATLGAGPSTILRIFVSKGVLITAVGVAAGAALTLAFSILQQQYGLLGLEADIYIFDSVPIAIDPWHYVIVIAGTLLLSVISTLVPALIASKLRPVVTLRFR